jgi:hypothetical protein
MHEKYAFFLEIVRIIWVTAPTHLEVSTSAKCFVIVKVNC